MTMMPRKKAAPYHVDAEEGIRSLLRFLGEDPDREGLLNTPKRVLRAMEEMTKGRHANIAKILETTFTASNYDQVILVRDIPFVSMCEHHMLPFSGTATVGYLPAAGPDGSYRVVGLSKIPRLVDAFAHRLQLQEQMTVQIAEALQEHLKPRGVVVHVEAVHSCMTVRGVRKTGASMVTSELLGVFREKDSSRAEVMALLRG